MIAGVLATRGDLLSTAAEFGFVVMALATVPLVGMVVRDTVARRRAIS